MPALEVSTTIESRHAIFVQRFAGGQAKRFEPFLKQLQDEIARRLREEDQTVTSQLRLSWLQRDMKVIQKAIYGEYSADLFRQLELFSESESAFELGALNSVIESISIELTLPTAEQVWAASLSNPLIFTDSNDVTLLEPFYRGWEQSEIKRVEKIIRTGVAVGDTTDEIARRITGKGGTLDKKTRATNKAMVRTATNHVSAIAREQTMRDNDDIVLGYVWISTLDSRTSTTCKARDGIEFRWKDKPLLRPPAHINCRSATTPLLDKRFTMDLSDTTRASKGDEGGAQISADTNYYSFLKNQSKAFQDETLGPTRGRLLRNGGLTAEEFRKLSVDDLFRPLSLESMREKNPMAFERAGLD